MFLIFSERPTPTKSTLFPYTTLFRSHSWPRMLTSKRVGNKKKKAAMRSRPFLFYSRAEVRRLLRWNGRGDRKSTRLNSSHLGISYAVFCLKKKKTNRRASIKIAYVVW